jgi:hypothetical protein
MKPLVEGEDYYWQQHLVVFTELYHRNRGYCCGMGCQHCPYDYEAVPEPTRSLLLEKQVAAKTNVR